MKTGGWTEILEALYLGFVGSRPPALSIALCLPRPVASRPSLVELTRPARRRPRRRAPARDGPAAQFPQVRAQPKACTRTRSGTGSRSASIEGCRRGCSTGPIRRSSPCISRPNSPHDFDRDGVVCCVNFVEANKRLPARLKRILEREGSQTLTVDMLERIQDAARRSTRCRVSRSWSSSSRRRSIAASSTSSRCFR